MLIFRGVDILLVGSHPIFPLHDAGNAPPTSARQTLDGENDFDLPNWKS